MARKRKQRRQQHGSAWHWKQTDCWYFTEPGTRKRIALFDEDGQRIRGKDNKESARPALARVNPANELSPSSSAVQSEWTVARVCDMYLTDLHRSANPDWAKVVTTEGRILTGFPVDQDNQIITQRVKVSTSSARTQMKLPRSGAV